jgi:hypothetical protein
MATRPRKPDKQTLIRGLESIFNHNGSARGPVSVIRREPCIYSSTFPSEIVTCKLGDRETLRLLCKYAGEQFYTGHGHRGGVPYEAKVYGQVLQPLRSSAPAFHGIHVDPKTGGSWLVLEYLDDSERVSKPRGGMSQAARWIGQFHAANEARLAAGSLRWLNKYDAAYYRGWARRTAQFAGRMHRRYPWLAPLCEAFEQAIPILLDAPQTVIHGEYYPHNILSQSRRIRPVDWESAARGAGEIDIASLAEGWPASTLKRCATEYRQARWRQGAPAGFERTLTAARLYMSLRWLGDERESTMDRGSGPYFQQVRDLGERLELI